MTVGRTQFVVEGRAIALVAASMLVFGCATFDTGSVARRRASDLLVCPIPQLEMTQLAAYRYRADGCGRSVVVVCSAAQLEPVCLEQRAATSGGQVVVVQPVEPAQAGPAAARPIEPTPASAAGTPNAANAADAIEAQVRSGLDARRADVLACAAAERVAVRVSYEADGTIAVQLQPPLTSTPEERCVQHALEGVRVGPGHRGVVIHLVD